MNAHAPAPLIFARASTAARMLDMSARKFLSLVESGALPPPVTIGGEERWCVDDLRGIADGTAARAGLTEDME